MFWMIVAAVLYLTGFVVSYEYLGWPVSLVWLILLVFAGYQFVRFTLVVQKGASETVPRDEP